MIISNNLIGKMPIPKDAIIRVNLAWVSKEEARKILSETKNDIYLDYPSGRTKPPKPTMTLDDAIELANEFKVKYFAVSNIECICDVLDIQSKLYYSEFVPKIETVNGVENIREITQEVDIIMLDKEDLYVDCNGEGYEDLINKVRSSKVKVLELAGVIFI
jgi:pyruvate kinase